MQEKPGNGREVLFCPNCGYDPYAQDYLDIEKISGSRTHPISAEPADAAFSCPRCSYTGKIFSIPEGERYKMEFDLDSLEEPVSHAQKGAGRVFLYLLGFIIIIISILQYGDVLLSGALAAVLLGSVIFLEARAIRSRKKKRP